MLADVFEKFIDTYLKYYELDPCHYFSAPRLSWDAMLKVTGVKLEKVSDIDQYLFIEKGTRGGVSYIAKRYAEANNKYMSDYDSNKQSTFITYLDKNNLEHVYMRPEVNSNRFEISNRFEMLFRLHGNLHRDFTAASFQTIARPYCTCANDIF